MVMDVGSKVRIFSPGDSSHGRTGVIVFQAAINFDWHVKMDDTHDIWLYDTEELEEL